MATDYTDPNLFAAAKVLYVSETSLSQHYETLRASLTAGNIAIVGLVAGSSFSSTNGAAYFLIALALVSGILAGKLSSAHAFHFSLAAKMRGIIARHHEKTDDKLKEVRQTWFAGIERLMPIHHALLWVGINALVPLAFAFILRR